MTVSECFGSFILRVSVFISCFPHLRPLITADSRLTFHSAVPAPKNNNPKAKALRLTCDSHNPTLCVHAAGVAG